MFRSRGLLVSLPPLFVLRAHHAGRSPFERSRCSCRYRPALPTPVLESSPSSPICPAEYRPPLGRRLPQRHQEPKAGRHPHRARPQGQPQRPLRPGPQAWDVYSRKGFEPVADDIAYPGHPNWDPLGYLIQKAHTANPPLEVHAWMNTFFVGQTRGLPGQRRPMGQPQVQRQQRRLRLPRPRSAGGPGLYPIGDARGHPQLQHRWDPPRLRPLPGRRRLGLQPDRGRPLQPGEGTERQAAPQRPCLGSSGAATR